MIGVFLNSSIFSLNESIPFVSQYCFRLVLTISLSVTSNNCFAWSFTSITVSVLSQTITPFAILIKIASNLFFSSIKLSIEFSL